jgi:hypothetical protein
MSKLKFRRGQLSKDDKQFILTNYDVLTPKQIAIKLQRNIDTIKKFIVRQIGHVKYGEDIVQPVLDEGQNELKESVEIKDQLRAKPEYKQLREEFSPDELKIFEHKYVKFFQQLREDILPSEEVQLFKAIKFDILMHRAMKAQRIIEINLLRLDKIQETLSQSIQNNPDNQSDKDNLGVITQSITDSRIAQSHKVREVRELNKEHEDLLKALKASREQRISRIENSKMSYLEVIKMLQDEEFREREGRLAGLTKLATQKEFERLAHPHEYADKVVDLPILSHETLDL